MSPQASSSPGASGGVYKSGDPLHVLHMSSRRAIAVFLLGALVGGFTGAYSAPAAQRLTDDPVMCTLIGGQSQIYATVSDQYADTTKPLKLVITMEGMVYTAESSDPQARSLPGEGDIAFPLPDQNDLSFVSVALHYSDRDGHPKIASYDGHLEEFTPNGPECPPRLVGLNLNVDADGRLVLTRDLAQS